MQQIYYLWRANFVSKLLEWRLKDEFHCNGQKSTTTCTRHWCALMRQILFNSQNKKQTSNNASCKLWSFRIRYTYVIGISLSNWGMSWSHARKTCERRCEEWKGGRGMGDVLFFTSGPLARASPRVLASLALFATRKGKLVRRLTCYCDKTLSIYLPHLPPFTTLRRSPLSHAATSIAHLLG